MGKGVRLTHLAVNGQIPARRTGCGGGFSSEEQLQDEENVMRSPTGLHILHGDFGPTSCFAASQPGTSDFDTAFWVSTTQSAVWQTWAPRWTMFSRGNVTEKARLLGFHSSNPAASAHSRGKKEEEEEEDDDSAAAEAVIATATRRYVASERISRGWAIDMYAGIGYFVFSYARLGMRVLCWEVNAWSVEGLRRGAQRNGYAVRVIRGRDLNRPMEKIWRDVGDEVRIIVFEEDNARSVARVRDMRKLGLGNGLDVLHVNCGLLPRSELGWRDALRLVDEGSGRETGWLHLHENVGVADIGRRRREIAELIGRWCEEAGRHNAVVEHVEHVKNFAPRVWHCVFDVCVSPRTEVLRFMDIDRTKDQSLRRLNLDIQNR